MNVFTYGSLVVPRIMRGVTGRSHACERATLVGYARYRLIDRVYPGLVPEAGSATEGQLYYDLDLDDLERLDAFEADEYDRHEVEVRTEAGQRVHAFAYVIAPEHRGIVAHVPWSEAHFVEHELEAFIEQLQLEEVETSAEREDEA